MLGDGYHSRPERMEFEDLEKWDEAGERGVVNGYSEAVPKALRRSGYPSLLPDVAPCS